MGQAESMRMAREFPVSWRGVELPAADVASLRVACRCSAVRFDLPLVDDASFRQCHCAQCRKWSCAAFATVVEIPKDGAPDLAAHQAVLRFAHGCERDGEVDRLACAECRSKLATIPRAGPTVLLAAGCIAVMPRRLAQRMRHVDRPSCLDSGAPWFAGPRRTKPAGAAASGSCACGACAFVVRKLLPTELQHCYCTLCQRYSGSAFQTWLPCSNLEFRATRHLELVRTTGHGQRHQCRLCGSVLTILYDSQLNTIWPAAGAIHDDDMPSADDARALYRKIHICCETAPPWYLLPDDGLPRLKYAC